MIFDATLVAVDPPLRGAGGEADQLIDLGVYVDLSVEHRGDGHVRTHDTTLSAVADSSAVCRRCCCFVARVMVLSAVARSTVYATDQPVTTKAVWYYT